MFSAARGKIAGSMGVSALLTIARAGQTCQHPGDDICVSAAFPLCPERASESRRTMKRILKILAIIGVILFLLPVAGLTALVAVNLRDEPLDPALAALLLAEPPQMAAAENGYFAWIGVAGPENEAPHAWGHRWYQEALRADRASLAEAQPLAIDAEVRKESLRVEDIACRKIESCLSAVARSPTAAHAVLDQGRVTLARGDVALAMPAYQEPWRPDYSFASSLPTASPHYRLLSATRFALAVSEERHDAALDLLARTMAFHRRQAQGASTLIEKLLALANLQADLRLLNQYLLYAPEAARQREARIAELLTPVPADVTSLQQPILTELRGGVRMFLSLGEENLFTAATSGSRLPSWLAGALGRHLYLPEASANQYFRLNRGWLAADALSGEDYRRAIATVRRDLEQATADSYALRNPVGHFLVRVGVADYGSFFLRRDDLLALHAMVALQFDLLRKQTRDAGTIARAVAAADLRHPHTGEVPIWDKGSRRLIHAALAGRQSGQPLAIGL